MTQIPINKNVLIWARNERGLSLAEASARLKWKESELEGLEAGDQIPTITQLRSIAAKYEIGFSSLLMPEPLPPTTRLNVKDFRTYESGKTKWNADLLVCLDEINLFIDALSDLRDADPKLLEWKLPKLSLDSKPEASAKAERTRVGLHPEVQFAWKTDSVGFRTLRAMIEAQGVFVYQVNAGKPADWRGLAVIDERNIPVIVLNGNEIENGARSFSLLHEYAHLLLRISAISNEKSKEASEVFCNQFAACFLMPKQEFLAQARFIHSDPAREWSDGEIRKLAGIFKSSMSSTAIRLEEVGLAAAGFYEKKKKEWSGRSKPKGDPWGQYYENAATWLGSRHIATVFAALDRGRIDRLDASEMLDVNPVNFEKLRSKLEERNSLYGWRT